MTSAEHDSLTDLDGPGLAPSLESGRVVAGRFRIERVLGSGGMGTVHEATQLVLDRRVALKVLHPTLTLDAAIVARFRREAKIMAGLRHPNIVDVVDAGNEGQLVFIVMEFLTGRAFGEDVESRKPMSPVDLLPLVIPVGRALSFVHARGIVHRDVKPDNIFLVREEDGTIVPKLLDFGIARPFADARSITAAGTIVGTPAYMAPEQAWGLQEITPAADQWAFGAMLYEALTGEIPHEAETAHALIVRRVSEPPRPMRETRAGIDPDLEAVVMRALATDPPARFESMDALLDALAPFAVARTAPPTTPLPVAIAATMTAPSQVVAPPPAAPAEPVTESVTPSAVPVAPSRWPRVLAALLAAASVAGAGYALTRREGAPAVTSSRPAAPTAAAVTLSFDFSPQEARIVLDGAELGAGHASMEVARGGVHALRVEAEGYLPYVDAVRADGDLRISRSLVRRDAGAGAVAAPMRPPAHAGHPPAVVPTPAGHVPPGRRPIDTRWPP